MKKLVLKQELFSSKNIDKAKTEYKHIANIMVSEKRDCFVVRFIHCKYNEERTIKEFENYLIGLENMQG